MADSPKKGKTPNRSAVRPKRPVMPLRPEDKADLVITPGGPRPRSRTYQLRPGEHISLKDGRIRIIETATGRVVKDLGESAKGEEPRDVRPIPQASGTAVRAATVMAATQDVAWIENAQWQNDTGSPILYFRTKWVVPPAPKDNDDQTIFLFNGMQPNTAAHILQPVLQWGSSHAGGGNYWAITNWWADGQYGAQVTGSSLVQVNEGDELTGVMTCTGKTQTGYSYKSSFEGHSDADVTVTDSDELTWAYETLEAYGPYNSGTGTWDPLAKCSDYPNTNYTSMYDIEIKTGKPGTDGTDASLDWFAVTNFSDCGQSCAIGSNASPGGSVNLFYRAAYATAKSIVAAQDLDGRLETFYIGTDDKIYHNWQTAPNNGWSGEFPLGGSAKQVVIGRNADGRLELFYVGTNNRIYHNWQTAPNNGWSGEDDFGGWAKQLVVGRNADGRLEVFYIGTDDHLYHNWQTSPNNGWSGEDDFGGWAKQIALAQNADGRLELFYVGTNDKLYHNWQTSPNNGWSGEDEFGGSAKQLVVGQDQDGRLEAFYVGTNDVLYHNWQTSPNNGWSGEYVYYS